MLSTSGAIFFDGVEADALHACGHSWGVMVYKSELPRVRARALTELCPRCSPCGFGVSGCHLASHGWLVVGPSGPTAEQLRLAQEDGRRQAAHQ